MYIWKVKNLADDLKNNNVTEYETVKYLILLGVMYALGSDPVFLIGLDYSLYDVLSTLSIILLTIFGTYYCYTLNRSGDNTNFLVRFVCISVPISFRIIAIVIFLGILNGIIFMDLGDALDSTEPMEELYKTDLVTLLLVIAIEIFYFAYVGKVIKKISHTQNA